jgi:hypothetical protein
VTLDKRTVALGIAAVAAVAAAVVVTVYNHDSKGSPQRRAVTVYIQRVNAIQTGMHAPLARVLLAYRDFTGSGLGPPKANIRPELAAAAATMAKLNRRLAAVPAPPEAQKLRTKLLTLVAAQADVTREVGGLASFSPAFGRELRRANKANSVLGAALRAIPVPKTHRVRGTKKQVLAAQRAYRVQAQAAANAQADAIDVYDASLARVIARLAALRPPHVLEPGYQAQLRAFRSTRAAGARLATGLRSNRRSDLAQLGRNFVASSRIAETAAAQRAQIAAIKRYNARARAISSAAADVQNELARLQRELP